MSWETFDFFLDGVINLGENKRGYGLLSRSEERKTSMEWQL